MNPFDFVKASGGGDSLMPILIFIIWIVISFFSNAKKKKIRQEQQRMKRPVPETHHAPESAAFPDTMTKNEEKRAPLYDEIRRELETVLSGKQPDEDAAAAETQPEESAFTLETQEVEEQSYEMPAPVPQKSEPLKVPVQLSAVPFNAYNQAVPLGESEGIESSAITDVFSKDPAEKSAEQLIVVREEVRKAFVWSEILAAPVALRDQS